MIIIKSVLEQRTFDMCLMQLILLVGLRLPSTDTLFN